jgi:hypothetical protein
MMNRRSFLQAVSVSLLAAASGAAQAQPGTKNALRVSYVVPEVAPYGNDDQLRGVAFSVRNEASHAVDSATFRIIVRNHAKETIDEQLVTRSFMNSGEFLSIAPDGTMKTGRRNESFLPPGRVMQITIPSLFIRGFRMPAGMGSVEVQVVELKLVGN